MTDKLQDDTKVKKTPYQTHWHSFWFGFMCALAVVLFFLLIGTVTNRISFNDTPAKKVAIKKTAKIEGGETTPTPKSLLTIVESLDVPMDEFNICMDEGRYAEAVKDDVTSGQLAGVKGTPHSFVLIDDAIYEIPGAVDEAGVREFFDDLLASNDPRAENLSDTITLASVDKDDWMRGSDNARITVIEYTDVDCPFCKKFHESTANIMSDYSNDVKWVFRHMPSDGLHPDARKKAEAAECIGQISGPETFWQYIDTLLK